MAFNKENFYKDGNSEEFFFDRTNPLANAANAEQLKIKDCSGCELELVADVTTVAGTTRVQFAAPTDAYNTKFIKVQITDKKGNFATGVGTGLVSFILIDTSLLSEQDSWTITLTIETGEGEILDCPCKATFNFEYSTSAQPLFIDTPALKGGYLVIYEVGGSIPITSLNLGSFLAGIGSIPFEVVVSNTKTGVLKIESVTPAPDVTTAAIPTFGNIIYQGDRISLEGTVNGSLPAGIYSGTVTVVSDVNTVVLTINFELLEP